MRFEIAAIRAALLGRDGVAQIEIVVDHTVGLLLMPIGFRWDGKTIHRCKVHPADLLEVWEVLTVINELDVMAVLGNEGVEFVPPFLGPWP